MYRSGFGMKNKLSNILRSSCNRLKHNPSNTVADVGLARFSSLPTERSFLGDFSKRVCENFVLTEVFSWVLVRNLRIVLVMFIHPANLHSVWLFGNNISFWFEENVERIRDFGCVFESGGLGYRINWLNLYNECVVWLNWCLCNVFSLSRVVRVRLAIFFSWVSENEAQFWSIS